MTKVVDVHNHAIPRGFVDEELTTSEGQVADLRPRRTDEALPQRELASAGIDLCLESITPKVMNYGAGEEQAEWGARAINDAFCENMRAYPGRVLGTDKDKILGGNALRLIGQA